jgi:hypothetical protein
MEQATHGHSMMVMVRVRMGGRRLGFVYRCGFSRSFDPYTQFFHTFLRRKKGKKGDFFPEGKRGRGRGSDAPFCNFR